MKAKVSLFVLAALVTILPLGAFASSSDDDDKDMILVKLPESTSPGGRCMDGSMAGYYIREGTDPSLFVIHLKGGGGCRDKEECDKRSTTTLGTSNVWSDTMRGTNFLDQNCDDNPDFCKATAIHVKYCTSDSHRGTNDEPSEESFGYYFDGHLNFQAIIEKLIAEKGIGNASNVMLTGGSAGAIGALFNVDWLANRLSNATVKSVPLAGWYSPGALADDLPAPYPPSDYPNFAAGDKGNPIYDIIQAGESPVDVWKVKDSLPADCLAAYDDEVGWWICASAHFAYKYIKSSIFMVHTQYDKNQIFSGNQAPQSPVNETELDTVKRYVQFWGNTTRESLQLVINDEYVTQKDHTDGVFAASCITHGTPWKVEIDGQTYRELVHDWFFQNGNFDDKYKLIESCDPLEGNEDYVIPCNEARACEYKIISDPDPCTCAAQLDLEGCLESFGPKTACISCASENSASLADAGCIDKFVTAICTYAQNNEIPDEFDGDCVVICDDDDDDTSSGTTKAHMSFSGIIIVLLWIYLY